MAVAEQIYRSSGQGPSGAPLPMGGDEAFGAGLGAELERAGGQLEASQARATRAEKERQYQVGASTAGVEAGQAGLDADTAVQDLREHAAHGAAGHVEAVTQAVDKRFSDALAKITDPKLRQQYAPIYERDRDRIIANEDGWSRGVRIEYQGANNRKMADLLGNRVFGNPDDETFTDALHTLSTTIGEQGMSADLTEKAVREGAQTLAVSRGRGMIEVDPAAALVAFSHGALDEWITPEQKAALVDKAQTGVQAAAVKANRDAAAGREQARGYLEVLGKRFNDSDPSISDDELARAQQLATVLGDEGKAYDVAKWRVWHKVDTTYRDASALQVSNQVHALDARIHKAGDKASPDDVVARDRLQAILERKQRLEQSDPLTGSGVAVAPLNPGDLGSIQARAAAANAAVQQTGHYAFLTPPEVSQFKEQNASGPNGRLATINFLARVASVDGQAALRAAAQIDPNDRTLRHALRVGPQVREMIVRGTVARQTLPARVNGPDGNAASLDTLTEGWFADNVSPALVSSQPEFADDVLDTARAIYSDWRRRAGVAGTDEEFNPEQFRRSVNLALGGAAGRGGVASWRQGPKRAAGQPYPVVLPAGMSQDEFERRMANLPMARTPGASWPAGSINGIPAYASGKPINLDDLKQRYVPVAVGDGVYQFRAGNQVVQTRDNKPFQLSIRRIPPLTAAKPEPKSGPRLAPIAPDYSLPSHPEVRGPSWSSAPGGEQ